MYRYFSETKKSGKSFGLLFHNFDCIEGKKLINCSLSCEVISQFQTIGHIYRYLRFSDKWMKYQILFVSKP